MYRHGEGVFFGGLVFMGIGALGHNGLEKLTGEMRGASAGLCQLYYD